MNALEQRIHKLGELIDQEQRPSTQLYYLNVLRQLQEDMESKRR